MYSKVALPPSFQPTLVDQPPCSQLDMPIFEREMRHVGRRCQQRLRLPCCHYGVLEETTGIVEQHGIRQLFATNRTNCLGDTQRCGVGGDTLCQITVRQTRLWRSREP